MSRKLVSASLAVCAVVVLFGVLAVVPAAASSPFESMRGGDQSGSPKLSLDREAIADLEAQSRIVGGNFTTNSKYPWQALVYVESAAGDSICGGSLIHPLIVVTAAHCLVEDDGEFKPGLEVLVLLGDTEIFEFNETHEGFEFWKHSEYFPDANPFAPASNDIGFITLDSPSALPRILFAGLDERPLWTPGREAFASGWGTTSEGGELSTILKEAMVPIIDDGTCAQPGIYGGFGFAASVMVCAGYLTGGQDTCQGDSGGPLQSPIDGGGFRLTGITSWGIGCARPNNPGVYTRVAADPLLQSVREGIPFIEEIEGFPPQYRGINVIGSGARPPGCSVAEQALAGAGLAASSASSASQKAKKASKSASRSLKRSAKAVKSARRAFESATTRHDKRVAAKRLAKATKKLNRAKRRARNARKRANKAKAKSAQANAILAAAAAQKTATCGA